MKTVFALTAALLVVAGCGTDASTGTNPTSTVPPSTPVASVSASSTRPSPPPGSATAPVPIESTPPGDIPDNVAFVTYRNAGGHYQFTHPEGWAEIIAGATVRYTDKLNGVEVGSGSSTAAVTPATANQVDIPALRKSQPAFELRSVSAVQIPAGRSVRIVYRRNSAADPVTGRRYRDEVERYEVVAGHRKVVVEMFGPVGADNVDAYRTMIQSLRIR